MNFAFSVYDSLWHFAGLKHNFYIVCMPYFFLKAGWISSHLWSHELQAPDWSLEPRRRDPVRAVGAAAIPLQLRAEIEVAELDGPGRVLPHAKDVVGLQVAVGDPTEMEELQSSETGENNKKNIKREFKRNCVPKPKICPKHNF